MCKLMTIIRDSETFKGKDYTKVSDQRRADGLAGARVRVRAHQDPELMRFVLGIGQHRSFQDRCCITTGDNTDVG